jgi:hypothetical protein
VLGSLAPDLTAPPPPSTQPQLASLLDGFVSPPDQLGGNFKSLGNMLFASLRDKKIGKAGFCTIYTSILSHLDRSCFPPTRADAALDMSASVAPELNSRRGEELAQEIRKFTAVISDSGKGREGKLIQECTSVETSFVLNKLIFLSAPDTQYRNNLDKLVASNPALAPQLATFHDICAGVKSHLDYYVVLAVQSGDIESGAKLCLQSMEDHPSSKLLGNLASAFETMSCEAVVRFLRAPAMRRFVGFCGASQTVRALEENHFQDIFERTSAGKRERIAGGVAISEKMKIFAEIAGLRQLIQKKVRARKKDASEESAKLS